MYPTRYYDLLMYDAADIQKRFYKDFAGVDFGSIYSLENRRGDLKTAPSEWTYPQPVDVNLPAPFPSGEVRAVPLCSNVNWRTGGSAQNYHMRTRDTFYYPCTVVFILNRLSGGGMRIGFLPTNFDPSNAPYPYLYISGTTADMSLGVARAKSPMGFDASATSFDLGAIGAIGTPLVLAYEMDPPFHTLRYYYSGQAIGTHYCESVDVPRSFGLYMTSSVGPTLAAFLPLWITQGLTKSSGPRRGRFVDTALQQTTYNYYTIGDTTSLDDRLALEMWSTVADVTVTVQGFDGLDWNDTLLVATNLTAGAAPTELKLTEHFEGVRIRAVRTGGVNGYLHANVRKW